MAERLRHVVLVTDFSDAARYALHRTVRLPIEVGGLVDLLHVVPGRSQPAPGSTAAAESRAQLRHWTAGMQRTAADAGRADLRVRGHLAGGQDHRAVADYARRHGAELVIIPGPPAPGFRDGLVEAPAVRIAHRGRVPVLAVRQHTGRPYQRPLLPSSLRAGSAAVLAQAARLVPRGVRTRLLHLYDTPLAGLAVLGCPASERRAYRSECRTSAVCETAVFLRLHGDGGLAIRPRVRHGSPPAGIIRVVERLRPDLLAMGAGSPSRLVRAIGGGVTSAVLHAVSCDVLIVPPSVFDPEP